MVSKFTKIFVILLFGTILLSCSETPRRFEKSGAYQMTVDSISVSFSEMYHNASFLTGKIVDSLVVFTDNKNNKEFNRSEIVHIYCLDDKTLYMELWGKEYPLPYDENTNTYHISKEDEYLDEFASIERCYTDILIEPLSSNQYNIKLYKLYDGHKIEISITAHNDIEFFKPMKRDEVLERIETIRHLCDIDKGYIITCTPKPKDFFEEWTNFLVLH